MATPLPPPAGAGFAHDEAVKTLDLQMRWIDALDTKAGILMASGGLLAGLLLRSDSPMSRAPTWISVPVITLLLLSLASALLAFAARRFETPPSPESLVPSLAAGEAHLKWMMFPDLLEAISINERKLGNKAELLFFSGLALLLAVGAFGAYHVARIVSGGST